MSVTDRLPIVEAVRSGDAGVRRVTRPPRRALPRAHRAGARWRRRRCRCRRRHRRRRARALAFDEARTFSDRGPSAARRPGPVVLGRRSTGCASRPSATRDGELLANLVDVSSIGVIHGQDDRILQANDAFLAMLGYRHADLEAGLLRWPELTPDEWRPRRRRDHRPDAVHRDLPGHQQGVPPPARPSGAGAGGGQPGRGRAVPLDRPGGRPHRAEAGRAAGGGGGEPARRRPPRRRRGPGPGRHGPGARGGPAAGPGRQLAVDLRDRREHLVAARCSASTASTSRPTR